MCQTIGEEAALLRMLTALIPLHRPPWHTCVLRAAAHLLLRVAAQGHLRLCQLLCALGTPVGVLLQNRRAWDDPAAHPPAAVARFYVWLDEAQRRSPSWIAASAGLPRVLAWHLRSGGAHGTGIPLHAPARQELLELAATPARIDPVLRRQPARPPDGAVGEEEEEIIRLCRAAAGSWRPAAHHLAPRPVRETAFFFLLLLRRLQLGNPGGGSGARLARSPPLGDVLRVVVLALADYTGAEQGASSAGGGRHPVTASRHASSDLAFAALVASLGRPEALFPGSRERQRLAAAMLA